MHSRPRRQRDSSRRLRDWRIGIVCLLAVIVTGRTASAQRSSGYPDVLPTALVADAVPPPVQVSPGPVLPPPGAPSGVKALPGTTPIVIEPTGVFNGPPVALRFVSPDEFRPEFILHQTIGDTVGDSGELTTLGGFFPHPSDYGLWFLDGRFHILEDAHNPGQQTLNFAANLGLGWRWFEPTDGQIYGLSVWYDVDRSHPGFVHQASVGAEVLGDVWEWRANGYFPCGANRQPLSFSSLGPTFFSAEALPGVDMECGRRLPGWFGEYGISVFGGWYYYRDDSTLNTVGASLRVEAKLSDAITIDTKATRDSLFKTNVAVGITWILPTAGKCKVCRPHSEDFYRLVQPVERNRTIVFGPAGEP